MRQLSPVDGTSQPTFCPECGAPAPFRGTTVTLVCAYCSSTIVRTGVDLQLVGKVSAIIDNGSPVLLGSRGRHQGVPFEVSGRLQIGYGRGAWNEWFVSFADGTVGWLADALGQFAVVKPRDASLAAGRVPQHGQLAPGGVLTLDGIALTVVDRRAASYRGAEGELPFVAVPGKVFHSADLRGERGEYVTLDYGDRGDHQRPIPYFGSSCSLAQLALHPLRRFQGWPAPQPGAPRR
ncbi:MAG: DUF4178 domain-containing protein [Deltaproteobacteria bacterium]|nr:DUF4178 domain-containing protein [Nannocystaceae bacterium]